MLHYILSGFSAVLTWQNIALSIFACFFGNLVGVLPGLGPTAAVSLLFPFTLKLPPLSTILCLGAIYYGAMYGGAITSVLLNIPGEVAAIPTAMDGYPRAKAGKAGSTLLMCALSSFFGGMTSLIILAFFAPMLARFALSFGSFEYLGLMFFSLCCACGLSGKSVSRGLVAALLGIAISMIGVDTNTTAFRLTFGQAKLYNGIDIIPIVVGIFGITEVLQGILDNASSVMGEGNEFTTSLPTKREWLLSGGAVLRGTFFGTLLGTLPGLTPSSCTFIAYSLNKRLSVEKDLIGKGSIEGVCCAESANNSSAMSGFIPLLALGIPTGPVLAIVMSALIITGVVPGPLMFSSNIGLTGQIIAAFFIGNLILLIMNVPLIKIWVKIAILPYRWLAPVILFLCMLGTIAIRYQVFDLWLMLAFGLLGFAAKKKQFPVAPMVLGVVLGRNIETYFRQSAIIGFEKISSHPVCIVAIALGLLMLIIFTVFKGRVDD